MKNYSLKIGWLYPELMSTYGDRGNILVLKKRCEWREIQVEIVNIDQTTDDEQLKTVDLLFGGGAQDREQSLVMESLRKKENSIRKLIEKDIPALFVCGSPQLFGNYYEPQQGKRIEGLGIFDMHSINPGSRSKRLIGNVIATSLIPGLENCTLVGFENHGGRTYLGRKTKPFAKTIKGSGNNGKDSTEGAMYRNAIGSYLHGPFLPKNPKIADWLVKKALEVKYKEEIKLLPLNDELEEKAKKMIANRLGVTL